MEGCNTNNPIITFVLPGDHRSGGVRVTVLMANALIDHGIQCRIACPRRKGNLARGFAKAIWRKLTTSNKNSGWLHQFKGSTETYLHLDDLAYEAKETVIAVGTYMVKDLRSMSKPVIKVRFNHGMPTDPKPIDKEAWKGSMPTITVSKTLTSKLEAESGEKVLAVIPNGIDRTDYYSRKDIIPKGIGAVFNPHQNKDHRKLFEVLGIANERWPNIPQYIFSSEPKPAELDHTVYTRYPSVSEACQIYNRAKAWIMTSKTEGLPGVALEAMSCGCVMVSSDNDGSLELIRHNKNGLIARQTETNDYLQQIELMLTNEALRQRLSKAAIATAKTFTWEKAADKMVHFLTRTLPNHLADNRSK